MIYLELFISFLKIGLFTFGGGYVMLSLIQTEIVMVKGWIDPTTFTDIAALSQMAPGPIGVNGAAYTGYVITGDIWGAIIATIGISLPSFFIIILIARFYTHFKKNVWINASFNGIKPVVIGLIAAVAIQLMTPKNFIDWKSWAIFGSAFIAAYFFKLSPIKIIIAAGIIGIFIF